MIRPLLCNAAAPAIMIRPLLRYSSSPHQEFSTIPWNALPTGLSLYHVLSH